jgi:hypothetical protein
MTTESFLGTGEELLKFVESLGTLVWRKYQQRFVQVWKNNKFEIVDRISYPPFASFRFEKEDPIIISNLKNAVHSYKGAVIWVVGEHKRSPLPDSNWIICPKHVWELNEITLPEFKSSGEYIAEREPEFGPVAYNDMLFLIAHLNQYKFL